MTATPAPAPALTDEQIDELTETARADFVASAADEDEIRADHETFDRWLAAVVSRAKREERGEISKMCDGYRASLYADERNREATKPARDALSWVTAKLRQREER